MTVCLLKNFQQYREEATTLENPINKLFREKQKFSRNAMIIN